ncbi:MAG: proliferating cell nuclear antigen (pcna) [Candidatus Woesearchaeota archaeon]
MRLTLAEPKYLKDSISVISELVSEVTFKVTPNGLELVAMDAANVSMVIFKLLSSAFTEFEIKKSITLGINLTNLKQVLRRAKPTDILTMEEESGRLKIQLRGNSTRTFSLPIIESEEREQKIPELTFPVTIRTTSTILNEAIEDVEIVSDAVSFIAEDKIFIIKAEGDLSQAKIEIKESEGTKIITDTSQTIKAKYSIEYLKKMINGSKLSEEVTIQFNNEYPLRLDYKVTDKLLLSFILAPRVEND